MLLKPSRHTMTMRVGRIGSPSIHNRESMIFNVIEQIKR
jgi:hypothetical protein